VRFRPSAIGLVVLTASAAVPARAQFSFDSRRIGMAGLSLHRDGDLQRYNAAYRAAPKGKNDQGGLTIPIPLGILQAIKDSNITFDTKDSNFNVIAIANLILNPPIFYQIKKPPTPTNDIAIGVGKDSLSIDLGLAKALIPQDRFAFGGSGRLMDIGFGIKGLRLSVFAFIEEDIGVDLSDSLRAFLRDGHQAHDNTSYDLLPSGRAQAGFAPSLGWAGKIAGPDPDHGLYFGANVHRYFGVAYAQGGGVAGIRTGSPIFGDSVSVTPEGAVLYRFTNHPGKKFGTGMGGDVGLVVIQGPIEFGLGVNDIGATLTWPQTEIDSAAYDTASNKFVKTVLDSMAQSKSKLPVSYLANVTYHTGDITFGANILNSGRGTTVNVGAEKRVGPFAVRGGVARDRRKQIQFGWGGGVRLGFLGLDVGFATTSQNLSSERGIVMATSLTIY
jgi:hypothetical protein